MQCPPPDSWLHAASEHESVYCMFAHSCTRACSPCIQARKEEKYLTAGPDVESTATSSEGSLSRSVSSDNGGKGANSYCHYSYLCAPPNGLWVDLKNGIQLQRTVAARCGTGGQRSGLEKGEFLGTGKLS